MRSFKAFSTRSPFIWKKKCYNLSTHLLPADIIIAIRALKWMKKKPMKCGEAF